MLDLQTDLLLAQNEKELASFDEDESVEGILAEPDLDVLALIEDEVILSLPISPRHDEGECSIGSEPARMPRRKTTFCRAGGAEKTALKLY